MSRKPKPKKTPPRAATWRRMDLHLHTPASSDYQESGVAWLDFLQRAEARGLDIIGVTDHNTVAGYRRLRAEIEELELLERLNRLRPDEKKRLDEYRRLLTKILVLPGFEFTATFGFHIIGLFSPATPIRDIEHILLNLNVPSDQLDKGSSTVGATADVLTAYEQIDEAGGLVIAAHANSSNGVAMRGFTFGGQTKIAYTQDPHLHALEVTDLEQKGRRATAAFFNGSKPEYPRRMHCIQGSDAHRLRRDPNSVKNLGLGDRTTEALLDDVSFESLRQLFLGSDFARTRPYRGSLGEVAFDYIQAAREQGPNIVQDFHDSLNGKAKLTAVLADVCAFANINGGTLYIGVSADAKHAPVGVQGAPAAAAKLQKEIASRLLPSLAITVDVQETHGKKIVRVLVPRGDDPPYAIDDNKIYLRQEAETSLAVRDEIVQLTLRGGRLAGVAASQTEAESQAAPVEATTAAASPMTSASAPLDAPRTGVEIVATEKRNGKLYHTVRDLRNGNIVKNVTRSSARHLWRYAIGQAEGAAPNEKAITWHGDLGLIRRQQKGNAIRFDLIQRAPEGVRVYYGVTDDGIHGAWKKVVGGEEE
ncbi:MAG: putative DNA binding domain-containing protein [Chloroflexi bacterium]|nr:putative DNA binding domain-containing protein [Chloroflexota bacterium]